MKSYIAVAVKWKIKKTQEILKLRTMYLSNGWNEVLPVIRKSA
ncbi:MAG TPA: hypothetical protein PLO89_11520 [Spirochaetota bacterium]|nr:hypothetical protein [Spirochaetota bacterium]